MRCGRRLLPRTPAAHAVPVTAVCWPLARRRAPRRCASSLGTTRRERSSAGARRLSLSLTLTLNLDLSAEEAVRTLVHHSTVASLPQAAAACRVPRGLRSAPRGRPHQAHQGRQALPGRTTPHGAGGHARPRPQLELQRLARGSLRRPRRRAPPPVRGRRRRARPVTIARQA